MTLPLLDIVSRYTTPSKSTNKQWSSPCVFCGGDDRFVILPYESSHNGKDMPPHAFCRQCNAWVTAEMLLQRKENISWQEAHAIVEGSKSLGDIDPGQQRYVEKAKKLTPAPVEGAPCQEWQWSAEWFYKTCKKVLWSEAGEKALQWLRDRGLSDAFIDSHDLGFHPQQDYLADWGVGEKIKLYRGIVIPYLGESQVWKLEFRRATTIKDQRYRTVAGSANALYGYGNLEFKGKAVMVEGVFDAIVMEQALQEAGIEGVAVVATGSTDGSKVSRWKMKLALCDLVVVAFDNDPDGAGSNAAEYWLRRLPDSRRWVPPHGDINDTWLKDKAVLIDAALSGFVPRKPCRVCAMPSADEDTYSRPWCAEHFPVLIENTEECEEYCYECGEDLAVFDNYGRAWCAQHMPGEPLPVVADEPAQEEVPNTANSVCEVEQEPLPVPVADPVVDTPIAVPVPPPLSQRRKEKTKTSAMCNTDGCEGIARAYDTTGGQWCPNCALRRDLVDRMAQLGFSRLEFSPGHFIEAGEEATKGFAKAMSGTAISLAIRECARRSERTA